MLSYLHGFHAGNHADVLKHTVLTALLTRLTTKDAPLRYIDTHAGAGGYDLTGATAQRNREHEQGIGKIWSAAKPPPAVTRLLQLVQRYNPDQMLKRYPGSPWLARECLRPKDQLCLFELHPAEHRALMLGCTGDRRVKVLHEDGLLGCVGLVPPPDKRGLLFVDPSYELRDEQRQVVTAVAKTQRRFATGVVAIWYPVIDRRWVERYERALRAASVGPIASYEVCVARESPGRGLIGSGMFVINSPWKLDAELAAALPWLAATLDQDGGGTYRHVAPPD